MELELKHLAAYLPFKLYFLMCDGNTKLPMNGIKDDNIFVFDGYSSTIKILKAKPILRPLSDITKEIEVNGEKFVPVNKILEIFGRSLKHLSTEYQIKALRAFETDVITKELPYRYIQKLIEWHIDVFSLIPNGLAIDINTLE